jgi:hypothetical protein
VVIGRRLGKIGRYHQWWLGDWLRYGKSRWGKRYVEAARITGYDVRTLANIASVVSAFELSRRRDNLSWSHHAAVAALPLEKQEFWLDRAVAEGFSVADLRTELRSHERTALGPPSERASKSEAAVVCPNCGQELR